MTDIDRASIRQRAEAVPFPKWKQIDVSVYALTPSGWGGLLDASTLADAEFIASMDPATTIALLDALDAAENRLATLHALHRENDTTLCYGCGYPWPCQTALILDGHTLDEVLKAADDV